MIDNKAAMHIMGDWVNGWFSSKRLHGVRLAGSPGARDL